MEPSGDRLLPNPKLRLREQVREVARFRHLSLRTEQTYWEWIRRFILFHGKRHPRDLGPVGVRDFLVHLAVERKVAAATQNQALNALVFLYKQVLGVELGLLEGIERPKRGRRLPVVLSRDEVRVLMEQVPTGYRLFIQLLYGTGMRLMEGLRLRVKDVDFQRGQILVRDGKGAEDRVTVLPGSLVPALREQLARVRALHAEDLAGGGGRVYLPGALKRKYPNADRELAGNGCFHRGAWRWIRWMA